MRPCAVATAEIATQSEYHRTPFVDGMSVAEKSDARGHRHIVRIVASVVGAVTWVASVGAVKDRTLA
jgi:hypothetical protein